MSEFENSNRQILFTATSALLSETGFERSDRAVLETLTDILENFFFQIGKKSRELCELARRTDIHAGDVALALIDKGIKLDSIPAYANRRHQISLPAISSSNSPPIRRLLQAGQKRAHPPHIPEHLPAFPDPHTYIRTATHVQPVTEYQVIKEKIANQTRDVQRALTKFIAKTGKADTLFTEENNLYPLIEAKPNPKVYLDALLANDQIFSDEVLTDQEIIDELVEKKVDEDQTEDVDDEEIKSDVIDNSYFKVVKRARRY